MEVAEKPAGVCATHFSYEPESGLVVITTWSQAEYWELRKAVLRLKQLREAAGLSLADVAERMGIDRAAICRLEDGQHQNPTIGTLNRYADALGKRLSFQQDTLLGGLGNDTLLGGSDADILLGEAGHDSLNGEGDSRDTLNGGTGTNTVLGLATEIDLAFVLTPNWRDWS